MDKHITDLETSERLQEAGVDAPSKWYHVRFHRRIVQRLQNSFLTRWIWRYWQHEDTGRVCVIPFWKTPGRRWYVYKYRAYNQGNGGL